MKKALALVVVLGVLGAAEAGVFKFVGRQAKKVGKSKVVRTVVVTPVTKTAKLAKKLAW